LLDLRPAKQAAKGHLPGAVSFPLSRIAKLIGDLPDADRKPPMVLYDAKDGKDAQKAAQALIKAGYGDVRLVTGGFAAWKGAKYRTAAGKFAKASYTPKPRTGEIAVAQFEKYAASLPADVMIIDVRNPDEVKGGMVKSAKNIPQEQLAARLAEIPKEKTIITQCTTGVRAEMAYHALKALGYSKVAFLNANVAFEKDGSYTITAK
jgi:rhodanese-related sulfurtransferase